MRTARKMAREFQSGVDQIVREAELDEARKTVTQAGGLNLGKEIEKVVDPTGETKRALNTDPTKAASAGTAAPQIAAPTPAAGPTAGTAPAAAPSPPPSSPAVPPASGSSSATERTPEAPPEPAAAGERRA
jgi:sec-independent protein translocase protein TatB